MNRDDDFNTFVIHIRMEKFVEKKKNKKKIASALQKSYIIHNST